MNNNGHDWRNIKEGREIPTDNYSDQPYIVKTDDGAWLCSVTTGSGHEGAAGQYVMTMRSLDKGKTWLDRIAVEPTDGPEASYSVMLKVPSGRIYIFYNHNTDNVRKVKADCPDGYFSRVDSLGYFVFKYSDDHGLSWSDKRYPIPIRKFACDLNNADNGALCYFWNVGKPFIRDGCGFVPHIKVGGFGPGFFVRNEGVLLKSKNILTQKNPEKIKWETLPDGDEGLKTPPGGGPIAGEESYSLLSDGSIYCVYRTIDGHPVNTYSRDGGHTWETPRYKTFADGRTMKHPRAANFAWKCLNGKYLYWFHNHGGKDYEDRNPVWLCGGIEQDSPNGKVIAWSQPDIVLYDDDPHLRMSYPDLVEEDGKYYLTETQKDKARVHEIPAAFLEKLWNQFEQKPVDVRENCILSLNEDPMLDTCEMPPLPRFTVRDTNRFDFGSKSLRNGFTIDLTVEFHDFARNYTLLDARTETGQGLCVRSTLQETIEIILNDGRSESRWQSDPSTLEAGKTHNIAVIVDGGPRIITFVVDGKVNDGTDFRQFGWGRFSPHLYHVNGTESARIAPGFTGKLTSLAIYDRALMVSEVIAQA